jgi:hypothetical protein
MSPPLPEFARLRHAVGGKTVDAITMFQVAGTSRAGDRGAVTTLPCGHPLPLSPVEAAACRTARYRCPTCGTPWYATPLTNDLLAALGSLGPLPDSGLTVLIGPAQ